MGWRSTWTAISWPWSWRSLWEPRALLVFSNTAGLLESLDDPHSTVAEIELDRIDEYVAMAQGRMKKKVLAAADAVRRGVGEVILADANRG